MRQPTHTPGPWTTGCGKNNTIAILAREWEARLVANVSAKDRSGEETYANANLICAAPDLASALLKLFAMNNCNYDRGTEDYQEAMKEARAALVKAGVYETEEDDRETIADGDCHYYRQPDAADR